MLALLFLSLIKVCLGNLLSPAELQLCLRSTYLLTPDVSPVCSLLCQPSCQRDYHRAPHYQRWYSAGASPQAWPQRADVTFQATAASSLIPVQQPIHWKYNSWNATSPQSCLVWLIQHVKISNHFDLFKTYSCFFFFVEQKINSNHLIQNHLSVKNCQVLFAGTSCFRAQN